MTCMTSNTAPHTHHLATDIAGTVHTGTADDTTATRRRTGLAWTVGGALWIAAGLLYAESGWRFRASSAVWLAADVVLAAGLVGLMVLRPHGPSRGAAVALIAALAARVLFAAAEVSGLVTGTENDILLPMAALLTALSSIAYGALARLADRRLRVASVVMGLYFFAVMLPFAIAGEPNSLAIGGWGIPAALIGLAISRGTAPRD